MWATRLRCPSEAAYPQPSPPPRFCPCRRATPPSAFGCSSPGEGAENWRSPRKSGRRSPPGVGVVALDQALRLKTFQPLVRPSTLRRRRLGDLRRSQSRRQSQQFEDRLFDLSRPARPWGVRSRPFAPGRLAGVGFSFGPAPFNNSRLMASRVASNSLDRPTNRCASSTKFPLIIAFPPVFKSPIGCFIFPEFRGLGVSPSHRSKEKVP